jgi:hypothetical protein
VTVPGTRRASGSCPAGCIAKVGLWWWRPFEGEGIYVLLFGGELEARRVSEGVHGEKDSRLVMTFDGARADPVSITRARFAKYVYAKAVAVQINLWPAGLQHHG